MVESSPSCVCLWKCMSKASTRVIVLHLSLLLWCCPASIENTVWCWNDPSEPGYFRGHWAFWPRSTTHRGTLSICTSMKSFHAIRKEMIFFPDCITKEARNNGTIGLLQPSIEMYWWNAQHYYEGIALQSNRLIMIRIVSMTVTSQWE